MRRILVIGVSSGVGKSTFARKLGEQLNIDVCHLDTLYWRPNWVEAPPEEFKQRQAEIVKEKQWIIEGNYTGTLDIRMTHADTIIYLEQPLLLCLYRVIKRRIKYHGRTRPDLTEGCPEKIDWTFLKFILTTYYPRKRKMAERIEHLKDEKRVVFLTNNKEITAFLEDLR